MTLISTEEKGIEARGHCTSMAITQYKGSVASLLDTSIDTVYPLGLGSVASLETCLLDHAHPPRTASAELSHLSVHGSASAAHPDTHLGTACPFETGGGDVSYQGCIDAAASSGGSTVDWQGSALAPQPPRTDSRPTMVKASLLQPGAPTVHRRLCIPYEVDENQIPILGYRTTMTMVLAAFHVDIPMPCSIADLRIHYIDEDGDVISISSDQELGVALHHMHGNVRFGLEVCLSLQVSGAQSQVREGLPKRGLEGIERLAGQDGWDFNFSEGHADGEGEAALHSAGAAAADFPDAFNIFYPAAVRTQLGGEG